MRARGRHFLVAAIAATVALALPLGAVKPVGVRLFQLSEDSCDGFRSGAVGICVKSSDHNPYHHRVDNALVPLGNAPTINVDLTTGSLPATLTYARTGDTVCTQSSASTVTCYSGSSPVWEDHGTDDGSGKGLWTFPSIGTVVNDSPRNFNCGTFWTCSASAPTVTNNATTGPDGTANAAKIEDTSNSAVQYEYISVGAGTATVSIWVKDATPAPGSPGMLSAYSAASLTTPANYLEGISFGSSSAWRRVVYTSANDGTYAVFPAGEQPGVDTASATGAVYVWGENRNATAFDYPLCLLPTGTSGQANLTVASGSLANVFTAGDADLGGEFLGEANTPEQAASAWWFRCATPDGDFGLKATQGAGVEFYVRGSVVLTANEAVDTRDVPQPQKNNAATWRAWYKPSTGKTGMRFCYNGACEMDVTGAASGSALATPTACYIGSYDATTGSASARQTKFRNYVNNPDYPPPIEVLMIGDANMSPLSGHASAGSTIYSVAEGRTRFGIATTAGGGTTNGVIAGQKAIYDASFYKGSPNIKAVYIQAGIVDLANGASASTVITSLQGVVNDVAAGNPGAQIFLGQLLPAKSYLDTLTLPATKYAVWQAVNSCINGGTGGGACSPITGATPFTQLQTDLNDGSDSLKAICDSGDHIHLLSVCRAIEATDIRALLTAHGVLP